MSESSLIIDSCVHPFFAKEMDLRDWIPSEFKTRGWPKIERPWYQAPGGEYREDLYEDGFPERGSYPASDPDLTARHVLDQPGAAYAILHPLSRGNLPDRLLNSAICAATNDWLADCWLKNPVANGRFLGTIRVNPDDPAGAVEEIERWSSHPQMVQIGVPLQSRDLYGKPQYEAIWEAAAGAGLPVAVHLAGGAGIESPPTPAGHVTNYPHYASYVPLNYMHHLMSLIGDGMFSRHPNLVFIFCDGGADIVTPFLWRMDTFWRGLRDHEPWVDQSPSSYLADHVRFCFSGQEGPPSDIAGEWMAQMGKEDILLYASNYPYWSTVEAGELPMGLQEEQRRKILGLNAELVYNLGGRIPA